MNPDRDHPGHQRTQERRRRAVDPDRRGVARSRCLHRPAHRQRGKARQLRHETMGRLGRNAVLLTRAQMRKSSFEQLEVVRPLLTEWGNASCATKSARPSWRCRPNRPRSTSATRPRRASASTASCTSRPRRRRKTSGRTTTATASCSARRARTSSRRMPRRWRCSTIRRRGHGQDPAARQAHGARCQSRHHAVHGQRGSGPRVVRGVRRLRGLPRSRGRPGDRRRQHQRPAA